MSKVIATITTSLDGYSSAPTTTRARGSACGGDACTTGHGRPWTYGPTTGSRPGMTAPDRAFFDDLTGGLGAGVVRPRDVRRGRRVGWDQPVRRRR